MQKISLFSCGVIFFMTSYEEITFLESEILEDDEDAPVGTLIHVNEDGTVEDAAPVEKTEESVAIDIDVAPENAQTATDEQPAQSIDEQPNEQPAQSEAQTEDVEQPVEDVVNAESTEIVEQDDSTEQETSSEVPDDSAPIEVNEQTDVAEPVQDEKVADESATEDDAQGVEEDVAQQEATVGQEVDTADAQVPQQAEEAAQEEVVADEQKADETAQPEQTDASTEQAPKVEKPKRARKPAQKAEAPVVKTTDEPASIKLDSAYSVGNALHDTDFAVEEPKKTKIVSTKQKQEKAEDLWAVAPVATKKTQKAKAEQSVQEEKTQEQKPAPKKGAKTIKANSEQPAAEQKAEEKNAKPAKAKAVKAIEKEVAASDETAPKTKKTTKVENTKNNTTEVKKVATKDKTPAPEKEVKATKATTKAENNEETVLVEGEGKTHGKFVIKKTDKGNFVFKLYSSNYRVVAIGAQAYTTLGAAKIGVQSIINNAEKAPVENQTLKNYETLKFPKWEIYLDKKGEYRLRLYATNGSLIATTNDGYVDVSGAKNGIAAVARAVKGCSIVRNDNLW